MPDKDVMMQIRAREEQYGWSTLDVLTTTAHTNHEDTTFASALLDALDHLAAQFRACADDYARAKLKGASSAHVLPLRHAASMLDVVIKQLDQPRRAPLGQIQPNKPISSPPSMDPTTHPERKAGLDELINDSVAAGRGSLVGQLDETLQRAPVDFDASTVAIAPPNPVVEINGDDVTAYLSGEVDTLPVTPPHALVGAHDQTDPADADAWLSGEGLFPEQPPLPTAKETLATMTPDSPAATMPTSAPPVPLLGQPGDAGAGYDRTYVPPGGVPTTFAELMTPVPLAALPAHLSHSQAETSADCAVQYRLTRIDRIHIGPDGAGRAAPVEQIPEWAQIGGGAFHAWVEAYERAAPDVERSAYGAAGLTEDEYRREWNAVFDAEIGKIEASSPVPRTRWRAANKGTEHEAWWRVNGPLMLARYLDARPDEPTATLPVWNGIDAYVQQQAVEIELTVSVDTLYGLIPYKAILDRVTIRNVVTDVGPDVTLVIRDYKTGRSMPEDTQQLGEYANVLRLLGVPPNVRIVGTFFNARKGVWTPEIDLGATWPSEWFTYYVTTAHARKLALTTGPTPARPSTFCGGCSVRWACPIRGAAAPQAVPAR